MRIQYSQSTHADILHLLLPGEAGVGKDFTGLNHGLSRLIIEIPDLLIGSSSYRLQRLLFFSLEGWLIGKTRSAAGCKLEHLFWYPQGDSSRWQGAACPVTDRCLILPMYHNRMCTCLVCFVPLSGLSETARYRQQVLAGPLACPLVRYLPVTDEMGTVPTYWVIAPGVTGVHSAHSTS
ncbi:hypothetical protein RRG08_027457 [Elysia crispata]|uniref:Uncharacterized protein n=1 Tax=Elysia crispata TaxID=231223 RepID=A0AAE0YRA8_9GAST|nr:hypothetical protein RRG08_027457 [Elysia crispata]